MFDPLLTQPAWLTCLVIVGGSMVAAGAVTLLVRPRVKSPSCEHHNQVAGFIFAAVATVHAVLLAFLVFAVWQDFSTADRAAAQEAATLLATARYAAKFPEPIRHQYAIRVIDALPR